MHWLSCLLLPLMLGATDPDTPPAGVRLKDLAAVEGVRDNQLVGYGLVVGLAGTGDRRQTIFSAQSLANMLERTAGVIIAPQAVRVTNMAAVMVTASLPAFARPGAKIDITVSAIGDAGSIQGGVLLITSLKGVDGQVYALAQGALTLGGYAAGALGSSKTMNHPTVGRVANGAMVERPAPSAPLQGELHWQLRQPDFTTAVSIAQAINARFQATPPIARAENNSLIAVQVPPQYANQAARFIAEMEILKVESDQVARIVINERTGTIAFGKDVSIAPASVIHGALTVDIQTDFNVSQPAPFARQGSTQVTPQVDVTIHEEKAKNLTLPKGVTVEQLVKALGSIGATPRDVIAILENLKATGALSAELEVI
jgi:flagellar P-ring protein FlgI